jgi:hypothetical protein
VVLGGLIANTGFTITGDRTSADQGRLHHQREQTRRLLAAFHGHQVLRHAVRFGRVIERTGFIFMERKSIGRIKEASIASENKFGGYLSPSMDIGLYDVPDSPNTFTKVALAGWLQVVAFDSLIEDTTRGGGASAG